MRNKKHENGFTLIEILVVIGMIAILATIVIIAINPSRQFAQSRNSQRTSNVEAILNGIGQNIADNKGIFTCSSGSIPTSSPADITSTGATNIMPCLVPTYMSGVLFDPSKGHDASSTSNYDTDYLVYQDANGRITVSANDPELGQTISISR